MIIELYIVLQIVSFIVFIISWFKKDLVLWALSVMLFGAQAFMSFNIQYVYTIATSTTKYITDTVIVSSLPMVSLNILFCMLSTLMFLWDIFNPENRNINIPEF